MPAVIESIHIMGNGYFYSPTLGKLSPKSVRRSLISFMEEDSDYSYRLVIGSDSQPNGKSTDFVTAIIVHKVGAGGRYFWKRIIEKKKMALKQRIFTEATLSLQTADEVVSLLKSDGVTPYDIEIHVDIGRNGKTRDMIAEIVGMIRGSGFAVKIKPDAYGASAIADRHA